VFYEVDQHDRKHRFGTFCRQCTTDLVDELKGKVEWLRIAPGWRGYVTMKARPGLEKSGYIHAKHQAQYIEIEKLG
jgi:hypothetical protein